MEIQTNDDAIERIQKLSVPIDDWLLDRAANAERIAHCKGGIDREGWLSDAAYFRAAAALVRLATSAIPAAVEIVDEWQADIHPDAVSALRAALID